MISRGDLLLKSLISRFFNKLVDDADAARTSREISARERIECRSCLVGITAKLIPGNLHADHLRYIY